jgi:hypothetical protein
MLKPKLLNNHASARDKLYMILNQRNLLYPTPSRNSGTRIVIHVTTMSIENDQFYIEPISVKQRQKYVKNTSKVVARRVIE